MMPIASPSTGRLVSSTTKYEPKRKKNKKTPQNPGQQETQRAEGKAYMAVDTAAPPVENSSGSNTDLRR